MKTQLTAEQSGELIKRGISSDRASIMCPIDAPYRTSGVYIASIFSLTDLFEILPKDIIAEDGEEYYFICGASYPSGDWGASYLPKWFDEDNIGSKAAPELIDCLYSLLLWLLDNNFLNKE